MHCAERTLRAAGFRYHNGGACYGMSLKAKLEAVIYAAEEPVTLNQLAALFGADALQWKAQQEAAAAEQTAEVAGLSPDEAMPLPLISEGSELASPDRGEGVSEIDSQPPDTTATKSVAETAAQPENAAAESDVPSTNPVVSISQEEAYPSIVVGDETVAGPAVSEAAAEGAPAELPIPESAPVDAETETKRLARQRDREVKGILKQLLDELVSESQTDGRGVEVREIAGGYRMATKPECHDAVRLFVKSLKPALKLSLPALETLAVIAYKQPVTAPEVSEIRGVESAGVLGSLLARKLIATAGRKPVIGRPILYKTTKEFLLRFGLKDVSELPSMEEFEKMAATELEMEPEAAEADAAADRADAVAESEAGPVAEETAEQNAEAILESNSPSGDELARTAESAETTTESNDQGPPEKAETGPELSAGSADSADPAETSAAAESASVNAEQADAGGKQESEANPNAQESGKEDEEQD